MPVSESKVTIHMVASVDGFIEKPDRSVSWLQSSDSYEKGITLTDEAMEELVKTEYASRADRLKYHRWRALPPRHRGEPAFEASNPQDAGGLHGAWL